MVSSQQMVVKVIMILLIFSFSKVTLNKQPIGSIIDWNVCNFTLKLSYFKSLAAK